jgi:hypothetical protein
MRRLVRLLSYRKNSNASGVPRRGCKERTEVRRGSRSVQMPTFLWEVAQKVEFGQEGKEEYGWPSMNNCQH